MAIAFSQVDSDSKKGFTIACYATALALTEVGFVIMIVGMCRMKTHHGSLCSNTLLWVTHVVFMIVALAIELAVLVSFCKADVGVAFYEVS